MVLSATEGRPHSPGEGRADAALAERIGAVHDDDKTQGAPRITAKLNDGAARTRSTTSALPG